MPPADGTRTHGHASAAAAGLRICAADPDSAAARALIAELSAALAGITGDAGTSHFDANDVRGPRAIFLIARQNARQVGRDGEDGGKADRGSDGTPVACGALRPLDAEIAEIKRMYARPGSHAGAALLAVLEVHARALGYTRTALSTRRINARAVAFYQRHGYTEIPPYGPYADRPQSICLGKAL